MANGWALGKFTGEFSPRGPSMGPSVFSALAASGDSPLSGRMVKARKIARYTLEALVVLLPLAIVIYFVSYPDKFDAFLDWMVRVL